MAGGIVRNTHAASSHMLPSSRLSLVNRLKAAASVNECDYTVSDTEQDQLKKQSQIESADYLIR